MAATNDLPSVNMQILIKKQDVDVCGTEPRWSGGAPGGAARARRRIEKRPRKQVAGDFGVPFVSAAASRFVRAGRRPADHRRADHLALCGLCLGASPVYRASAKLPPPPAAISIAVTHT